jgi:hypothetical protein
LSYTYSISFNSSDYIDFTPTNSPVITTEKESDNWFHRDKVDMFKINRKWQGVDNSTVYDLLEDWFDDSTKYGYNIRIKIQKSAVTKYNFIFAIKQILVDYERKYIEIKPEPDDVYRDILYYKDRETPVLNDDTFFYVDEDDTTPAEYSSRTLASFNGIATTFKNWLNTLSSHTYTIQSAFLWNDNYPDETSPGANNYISSDYNYLNNWAIGSEWQTPNSVSFDTILKMPEMFQCYWHCGSDYTIHWEHVRWYKDQIDDFQLNLTGSDYYDDARVLRYSEPEVKSVEKFLFPTDNSTEDWDAAEIVYAPEQVLYSNEHVEFRVDHDTYLTSDYATQDDIMAVGSSDLIVDWASSTFDTWTHTGEGISGADITLGDATASGREAISNRMGGGTSTINYTIVVDYGGIPNNEIQVQGYNGSWVGSPTTLNQGTNTGTVTGHSIGIKSTGSQTFDFTIRCNISARYRIPWEDGIKSSDFLVNNYLSWANIINRFWKDDRYGLKGYLNGSASETTFVSTKNIREQNPFKFHYAGDINPMRGIKTDYGIGMIQSMERDLDTDFVTLKLRYE